MKWLLVNITAVPEAAPREVAEFRMGVHTEARVVANTMRVLVSKLDAVVSGRASARSVHKPLSRPGGDSTPATSS